MNYIVTNKATAQEVFRYSADAPIEWVGQEFATHDHTAVAGEAQAEQSVTPAVLTKTKFLLRFTADERVGLRTVAKTNPYIEDYMALLDSASEVDLGDPTTTAGVHTLEQFGLLVAGRAAEILETSKPVEAQTSSFGSGQFPVTHRVHGLGEVTLDAGVSTDGIVRLIDGRWSTVDALLALGATLEKV